MSRRSSRRLSSDEFRRGDQVWLLDNGELYFATVEQRVIGSNRLRLRINRKDINLPSKDQLDNARQYEPESLIRHHDHSSLVNSFQRGDGLSLFNLVQLPHECMTLADIVFHYFRAANNMNSEGRKISTMACLVPFGDNSYILKCPELNSRKLSTVIFSEQMKMSTRDSILQRIKQGVNQSLVFLGEASKRSTQTFQQYSLIFIQKEFMMRPSENTEKDVKHRISIALDLLSYFGGSLGLKDINQQQAKFLRFSFNEDKLTRIQLEIKSFEHGIPSCSLIRSVNNPEISHDYPAFEIFSQLISNNQQIPHCRLFDSINKYSQFSNLQHQYQVLCNDRILKWLQLLEMTDEQIADALKCTSVCLHLYHLVYDSHGKLVNNTKIKPTIKSILELLMIEKSDAKSGLISFLKELPNRNLLIEMLYTSVVDSIVSRTNQLLDTLLDYQPDMKCSGFLNMIQLPEAHSDSTWRDVYYAALNQTVTNVLVRKEYVHLQEQWRTDGIEYVDKDLVDDQDKWQLLCSLHHRFTNFDEISNIFKSSGSKIIRKMISNLNNIPSPSESFTQTIASLKSEIENSRLVVFHCITHDFNTATDPFPSHSQFNACLKRLQKTGLEKLINKYRTWPTKKITRSRFDQVYQVNLGKYDSVEEVRAESLESEELQTIPTMLSDEFGLLFGKEYVYINLEAIRLLLSHGILDDLEFLRELRHIRDEFNYYCAQTAVRSINCNLVNDESPQDQSMDEDEYQDFKVNLNLHLDDNLLGWLTSDKHNEGDDADELSSVISDDSIIEDSEEEDDDEERYNPYSLITIPKIRRAERQKQDSLTGNIFLDMIESSGNASTVVLQLESENIDDESRRTSEEMWEKQFDIAINIQLLEKSLRHLQCSSLFKAKIKGVLSIIRRGESISEEVGRDFITSVCLFCEKLAMSPSSLQIEECHVVVEILKGVFCLVEPNERYYSRAKGNNNLTRIDYLQLFIFLKMFGTLIRLLIILTDMIRKVSFQVMQPVQKIMYLICCIIEHSTTFDDSVRQHMCEVEDGKSALVWELVESYRVLLVLSQNLNSCNFTILPSLIEKIQRSVLNCLSVQHKQLKKEIESHNALHSQGLLKRSISSFFNQVIYKERDLIAEEMSRRKKDVRYSRAIQTICLSLKCQRDLSIIECVNLVRKYYHIFSTHPDFHHVVAELIAQIPNRSVDYLVATVSCLNILHNNGYLLVNGRKQSVMDYAVNGDLLQSLEAAIDKSTGSALRKILLATLYLCNLYKTVFHGVQENIPLFHNRLGTILASDESIQQFLISVCGTDTDKSNVYTTGDIQIEISDEDSQIVTDTCSMNSHNDTTAPIETS